MPLVEWLRVDETMREQIRRRELSAIGPSANARSLGAFAGESGRDERGGIQTGFWLMKYDEFAFFNQQLAAMLRDGIPLEGALRRLCQEMRRGNLRDELQALEADLAKGTPMADALQPRQLPELYKRMILVGVKSGDLPGALTMLADYFQRQNNVWTRLKSMMTYPLIVMFAAFLIVAAFCRCIHRPSFIWGHVCAAWRISCPAQPLFALGHCECHLGVSCDVGVLLWLIVGLVISAGAARKISLAVARFQGSHVSRIASSLACC